MGDLIVPLVPLSQSPPEHRLGDERVKIQKIQIIALQFCNKKIVSPSFACLPGALVLVVDRCGVAARSSSSLLAVAVAPGIACSDGSGGYGVQANQVEYRVETDQVEHHIQVDLGVGDVCFFLTMRCFNDAMFSNS